MLSVNLYSLLDIKVILKEALNVDYSTYEICCAIFPNEDNRVSEVITFNRIESIAGNVRSDEGMKILSDISQCIELCKFPKLFIASIFESFERGTV